MAFLRLLCGVAEISNARKVHEPFSFGFETYVHLFILHGGRATSFKCITERN